MENRKSIFKSISIFYRRFPNLFNTTIFIFLVLLISLWVLQSIEKNTRKKTGEALQTALVNTQEGLHIWFNHRMDHLQQLLDNQELILLTEQLLRLPIEQDRLQNSPYQHQIRKLLTPSLLLFGDQGIFLINREFRNIASMRDTNLAVENLIAKSRPQLLKEIMEGQIHLIPPIPSDVPLNMDRIQPHGFSPTMFIAGPVRNQQGKIIAALALRIAPGKNFTNITQLGRIGNTGETYAIDREGYMLTNSRFEEQLQQLNLIDKGKREITNLRITDPGGNLLQDYIPIPTEKRQLTLMAQNAIAEKKGTNTEGYRDYRGVEVFGSWLWDSKLGIGLTTEIDASEALAPFYQTQTTILLLILATLILFLFYGSTWIRIRIRTEAILRKTNEQLEERVILRTRELLEANDTKTRFFHIIAHDLRAPISGMSELTRMLLDEFASMKDDEKKELLNDIVHSASNTYELLRDLLEWAQSQEGKITANPQILDFVTILKESLSPLKGPALNKDIHLTYNDKTSIPLFADPFMLTTVIRNLVGNAIKFSHPGGQITIKCETKGKEAEISISDDGIGMPGEIKDNIFRIDSNVSRPGTQKEEGSGLGLILCKEYIEKNNGAITVESQEGKGTVFRLLLPIPSQAFSSQAYKK
jgi:signal transduction histidine kinase